MPKPVGRLFAVPIAMYGCGMYLTRVRTARLFSSGVSRSNMSLPETTAEESYRKPSLDGKSDMKQQLYSQAVPPRGTSSSSPVPSS